MNIEVRYECVYVAKHAGLSAYGFTPAIAAKRLTKLMDLTIIHLLSKPLTTRSINRILKLIGEGR